MHLIIYCCTFYGWVHPDAAYSKQSFVIKLKSIVSSFVPPQWQPLMPIPVTHMDNKDGIRDKEKKTLARK
jgi:hypothetical protein